MKVELFEKPYGSDLTVVNAARVSFGKRVEKVSEADERLIQYLARGLTADDFDRFLWDVVEASDFWMGSVSFKKLKKLLWEWRRTPEHFMPFAHPKASFHITAPIAIARQLSKHQVGMEWSEVSRRYVDDEPSFHMPVWRKRAENVKQGSTDEVIDVPPMRFQGEVPIDDATFHQLCLDYYNHKLNHGVCPEQARFVLPQDMMTEWIWTGSLYGWANVYNKRKPGSHAQRECWPIAEQIAYHMEQYFPISWKALTQ
jgi:thymidylate synthase (FAD)